MLRWCSYCQRFQGEAPPYDQLAITHGICPACLDQADLLTDRDLAHIRTLQAIQGQLGEAGERGDLKAAEQIIEDAAKANVRAMDILLGVIAPMLYQIGEDWKRAIITVADEHRFTAFCEDVFELVAAKVKTPMPAGATKAERPEVLLMNASGNHHTLAVRLLALWLDNMGVRARVVDPTATLEDLIELVSRTRPERLLVSMALAEQRLSVVTVAERIAALPDPIRPQVVVGGYAVKSGLVQPIPGADFMADINSL